VNFKHHAHHFGKPGPFIFRIGSTVNAHEPFAGTNEFFKRSLLILVQDIACGIEKNYNGVGFKCFIVEDGCILMPVNRKVMPVGQHSNCGNSFMNGFVVKAIRFGEKQGLELLRKRRQG
jgi:hypothetical protein